MKEASSDISKIAGIEHRNDVDTYRTSWLVVQAAVSQMAAVRP